jgi:hypothetical protein
MIIQGSMSYSRLTRSRAFRPVKSAPIRPMWPNRPDHTAAARLTKLIGVGFRSPGRPPRRTTAFTVQPVMHGAHATGADRQALDSARVSLAAYGILADAAFSSTQRLRCGRNAIHDIVVDSAAATRRPDRARPHVEQAHFQYFTLLIANIDSEVADKTENIGPETYGSGTLSGLCPDPPMGGSRPRSVIRTRTGRRKSVPTPSASRSASRG